MTVWDPQVQSRVVQPYPGYPFLNQHSIPRSSFFVNVRSNAPSFNFSSYKWRISFKYMNNRTMYVWFEDK
jgi:hypothetical protein